MEEQFSVETERGWVSAIAYKPGDTEIRRPALILAHGAGAGQRHAFMAGFARALAERGVQTTTFNFLYTEVGRRVPDASPVLEACFGAVIDEVRRRASSEAARLVIGGKSLGGRIATQLAARDPHSASGLAGIICLGYPLHPPGRPDRLRTAHLPDVPCPLLIVQGSRDAFGTPTELRPIVETLPRAALHVVEGGDHSFKVPKRTGPPQEAVHAAVQDEMVRWIDALSGDGQGQAEPA